MRNQSIQQIMRGVKLLHLARASGIPLATLWRWHHKNAVPGHAPVKALHIQRLREGVRKCKEADLAELEKRVAVGRALLAQGVGERHWNRQGQ